MNLYGLTTVFSGGAERKTRKIYHISIRGFLPRKPRRKNMTNTHQRNNFRRRSLNLPRNEPTSVDVPLLLLQQNVINFEPQKSTFSLSDRAQNL